MYEVIVGNIGSVYTGEDREEAYSIYIYYVRRNRERTGVMFGESVTMLHDDTILEEQDGWSLDEMIEMYLPTLVSDRTAETRELWARIKRAAGSTHAALAAVIAYQEANA